MGLAEKLRRIGEVSGARFFGVADVTAASGALPSRARPYLAAFHGAISIGVPLLSTIVEQLRHHREPYIAAAYRHHYGAVNHLLDQIALQMAHLIETNGHRAWPVAATQYIDDEGLQGAFPHKLAAHLAGLGWIGKSCLLITPQLGPRVRWTTVLTDAPLDPTGRPQEERCGDCRLCVDGCPAGAFTNRRYVMGEPREARYDARKCRRYHRAIASACIRPLCGVCVSVCPYGTRADSQR